MVKNLIKHDNGGLDPMAIVALVGMVAVLIMVLYLTSKYLIPASCSSMQFAAQWIPWC